MRVRDVGEKGRDQRPTTTVSGIYECRIPLPGSHIDICTCEF